MRLLRVTLLVVLILFSFTCLAGANTNSALSPLVNKALSANSAEATVAINELRAHGPEGLQALFEIKESTLSLEQQVRWKRALDSVAQQRDAYFSHLYWYTDLKVAQLAATEEHKPILTLRMLGRLDEELSCANSRFFRTALYANREISEYLRANYILHWQSVRPVPKVTIDFGDGRKRETTITGNSIHYILDSNGFPVDGLPGLNTPKAFLQWLKISQPVATKSAQLNQAERGKFLLEFHNAQRNILLTEMKAEMEKVGLQHSPQIILARYPLPKAMRAVPAADAGLRAMTKSVIEMPMVSAITEVKNPLLDNLDNVWDLLGSLRQEDAQLDANSQAMILAKNRRFRGENAEPNDQFYRTASNFQISMAKDSQYNKYLFHNYIHQWLSDADFYQSAKGNIDELNRQIYQYLFLTPDSDPWLGLVAPDAFSGIEEDGVKE